MGNMKNAKRSRPPTGSRGSPAVTSKGKATVLGVVTSLEKPVADRDDELPAKQPKKQATQKGAKDDEKEVSKKEVSKKEVSKKEVSKKDVSKKEVSKKEVSKKEVSKKEVSKKEVSKKEVSKKEVSKKDVSKKDVSNNEVSKNEMSKNEVSKDEMSKKETGELMEKTLLPEGCEVPVEVTPVLLIKNVFTEQGECLAPEGKGQFMEGNRIQLVGAAADSGEESSPKATPRRGRLAKKQQQPSGSKGADKAKDATQKDTKQGRTPKGEVESAQEDSDGVTLPKTKSSSSSSNKGAGDGEKSEKVESLEDAAPREKWGRPPKRKLSDAGVDESETASNRKKAKMDSATPSPVKKRGRGRPPKEESGNSAPKKDKKPPQRKIATPGGAKNTNVKSKIGRPRRVTESSESSSDTPAGDSVVQTPDIVEAPFLDSASARRSRQLKAKKIFEDYEEYTPTGKPIKKVVPVKTTPRVKTPRVKKTKKVVRDGPIEVVAEVNTQRHSSDDDNGKVTDNKLEDSKVLLSKSGGTSEHDAVDASKKTNVSSTDSLNAPADNKAPSEDDEAPSADHEVQSADHNVPSTEHKVQSADHKVSSADHKATPTGHQTPKADHKAPSADQKALSTDRKTPSADHKAPSAAQVIIIKSKPKAEGSTAGKSKDKPTPVINVKCTVGNASSKQTKVLPSQNKMPRQQRNTRLPAKRLQVTSLKSEMCVAPEIKLDLPVGPLIDSINMSTQPEIRTLYMFQNTSTNGWLKIICKRISGVQFYQCPLCPYKDPVPRKVADHLHEDHPSLVSIAEGKCTRIFATFLFMFCRHCDFIAYEKLALWYHFEQYHGLTDMINAKPIDPESINMAQFPPVPDYALKTANTVLRCNECDFLSLSKRHAMNHVLKEHSGLRSCIGNGFVIISQLDAISSSGDEPPPSDALNLPEELKSMVMKDCFVCTECMFVTYKRALMEIHCVNNHAKRLLLMICSVCGDQFDTTYKMSNHIANSHSESKRQFCSVTLVDADGLEDTRLVEYNKQRKAEAAVAAASQALVSTAAASSIAQSTAVTVATAQQKRPAFTGANILESNPASRVSAVKTPQHGRPAKTRPVAVVSGSSYDQTTSARKVWPGQSVVKPVQQQHRSQQAKWLPGQTVQPKALPTTTSVPVRSAELAPSTPSQNVVQIQPDNRQQNLPVAVSSPEKPEVERQLTYIQMPDGSHHQVELAEDENGQLQYVLTDPPVTGVVEAAPGTAQQTSYVKLADGSVQPLASAPETELPAESTQEIRYLQMPDGTLHQLPAESEAGQEIHYMQLADGSLQQISAVPEGRQSAEGMQEVHYMQFPDGSIQQVAEGGPVEGGEQVLYGKLPDGTIQQLTEGAQLPDGVVQTVTEGGQEMHCLKLPDGRFQQVTESGHEVCYVKMPDGSIQQVAEGGQSVENGESKSIEKLVQLNKETVGGNGGQTEDGEQYVQYVIEMDDKQQSDATSKPQTTPCVADGNDKPDIFTGVQTLGSESSHVTMADQSAPVNVAESRTEGTKMVSLLSQDVLANVQAQQTTVATAAPSEPGTEQPMMMQAYNVNGETVILCCDPQAAVSDEQAAQALLQPTTETENAASNGQQVLYIENEPTSGNFEDAFQTFVNSNSTQQQ